MAGRFTNNDSRLTFSTQRRRYSDCSGEVAFAGSFLWIPGDTEIVFRFPVTLQAVSDVVNRHHHSQGLAFFREFTGALVCSVVYPLGACLSNQR